VKITPKDLDEVLQAVFRRRKFVPQILAARDEGKAS